MFSAGLSLNYSESANPLPYVSRLAEFNFFRRLIVSNNDGNIPKRAIIYMRVSSQKQVENQSIESQLRNCVDYIEEHGYQLVGDFFVDKSGHPCSPDEKGAIRAYLDPGVSAFERNRKALDQALRYQQTVGFDVVVSFKLDRFAPAMLYSGRFITNSPKLITISSSARLMVS